MDKLYTPCSHECSECESMHGLEKTKVVAQSLRGAVDWIENVCREVG